MYDRMFFIPGELYYADILTRHCGYSQIWPQLKALWFWKGDRTDIDSLKDILQINGEY
jgi:hypothetical protein